MAHRALIMRAVDEGKSMDFIHKEFDVHPNTVRKYMRQSLALLPLKPEVERASQTLGLDFATLMWKPMGKKGGGGAAKDDDYAPGRLEISAMSLVEMINANSENIRFGMNPVKLEYKSKFQSGQSRSTEKGAQTTETFVAMNWRPGALGVLSYDVRGFWVLDEPIDKSNAIRLLLRSCRDGGLPVPEASSGGGLVPSSCRLEWHQKVQFAQVLGSTRLSLSDAAEYIRVHVDSEFPKVSLPTLSKTAKELGLRRREPNKFDPKSIAGAERELERTSFVTELERGAQGELHLENLSHRRVQLPSQSG